MPLQSKTGGVAQVVEHLPEALSSSPSTTKKKPKTNKKQNNELHHRTSLLLYGKLPSSDYSELISQINKSPGSD
jgi:hypothetical protein